MSDEAKNDALVAELGEIVSESDGTAGDPVVGTDLERLAKRDRAFLANPPKMGDPEWMAFDDHRRRLSGLRRAMDEIGLTEHQQRIFYEQFCGFQEDGRDEVSAIADERGMDVREVEDFVREVTVWLGRAGWTLDYEADKERQAEVETRGVEALPAEVADRQIVSGMDMADEQLLTAYADAGTPDLDDDAAMDALSGSFGMESSKLRAELRKSLRRFAVRLG